MGDPWTVLGIGRGSSLAQARAARRRLAKQLHPDLHTGRSPAERAELARRMTLVNLALAELELELEGTVPAAGPTTAGPDDPAAGPTTAGPTTAGPADPAAGPTTADPAASPNPRRRGRRPADPDGPHPPAVMLDADTFAVGALPAEAFEALFLVAYGLGEILVADEPYALDTYLAEPAPCFCRLTLVPEAGGSIVTLELVPAEGTGLPPVEAVRDLFVSELNQLAGGPSP